MAVLVSIFKGCVSSRLFRGYRQDCAVLLSFCIWPQASAGVFIVAFLLCLKALRNTKWLWRQLGSSLEKYFWFCTRPYRWSGSRRWIDCLRGAVKVRRGATGKMEEWEKLWCLQERKREDMRKRMWQQQWTWASWKRICSSVW